MARRKAMMTVYLAAEQRDELLELAARTRIPMNIFIRDGVDLVLKRERAKRTALQVPAKAAEAAR